MSAPDLIREAIHGLKDEGVDTEHLTERELAMFWGDMQRAIRNDARGWATAFAVLREHEAAK